MVLAPPQSARQERHRVRLRRPHVGQESIRRDWGRPAPRGRRGIIRAGRRFGKTTFAATMAASYFMAGYRVLYAAPTAQQLGAFWREIKRAFRTDIEVKTIRANETEHSLEIPYSSASIRAQTAWNADTLRGSNADLLIFDEWQLMDEDAWESVGQPMLLDTNGDALFLYTPPSIRTRGVRSKARNKRHAADLFKRAENLPHWQTWHYASRVNPILSRRALELLTQDMPEIARRQEIEAEDLDEAPGALWKRSQFDERWTEELPRFIRVVMGIDPASSLNGTIGAVIAGLTEPNTCGGHCDQSHALVLADVSVTGLQPLEAGQQLIDAYYEYSVDELAVEENQGGMWIRSLLRTIDDEFSYSRKWASVSKEARAAPVVARYQQGRVHHVGELPMLEDEQCEWEPGDGPSPDRIDALVWAISTLMPSRRRRQMRAL